MPTILACLPDRLYEAVRKILPRLVRVGSLAEVRSTLRTSCVDGLVCDPGAGSTTGVADLFWLATDFPDLHITVYAGLDPVAARMLERLAAVGVTDVVLFDYEHSAERWDELLVQTSVRATVAAALQAVDGLLSAVDQPLRFALEDAFYRPRVFRTVDQLAAAAGTSRRAVYRKLHNAGIRAVREWIDWGRMVNAFALLRDDDRTTTEVARLVGYADGGQLGGRARAVTGYSLPELQRGIGTGAFIARMRERLIAPEAGGREAACALHVQPVEGRRRA